MTLLAVPDRDVRTSDIKVIRQILQDMGIGFEQWQPKEGFTPDASTGSDTILHAYADDIERLKREHGYATADVINITPTTPGLEAMLAKFDREHTHEDDEVRFTVAGCGVFSINVPPHPVAHITVEAGDLLLVPAGTRHWFQLTPERTICTIRLFVDASGWTPHYTDSKLEQRYPLQEV